MGAGNHGREHAYCKYETVSAGGKAVECRGWLLSLMMRRWSVSSAESQAPEKDWESFGTNPASADLRRKPSNRSRWAEFVNPHHDGDAYCNFGKNSRFKYRMKILSRHSMRTKNA